MKKLTGILTLFLLISGSQIHAQEGFVSLEGRFSSFSNSNDNEILNKIYLSPTLGFKLGENFYLGVLAKIYRSNYIEYYPFNPSEPETLNTNQFGIFADKNIELSERFLLRLRPSILYRTKDTFSNESEGMIEIQFSPGITFKAGKRFYLYTNFRGIGIEDNFYFDFGFDHLNIGLQYNFLNGEE